MSDEDDKAAFVAAQAKLDEMKAHHSVIQTVEQVALDGLEKVWSVAEPLGEVALQAAVQSLVASLTAKVEEKLGGLRA